MIDSTWWPTDYFASRDKFIELAQACGARTESSTIEPVGPQGEALSVDVASCISEQDEHRIVLTSGVHGVEGFIGASIQFQALRRLAQSDIPNRTGIVMIHAVNPWGFAHLRRVDENNVDVNRNFIDFTTTRPVSPVQYATLDPVINPRAAPSGFGEMKYWLQAGKLIVKNHGIEKLVKPIAEGQCDYPQGLFFTGLDTSPSSALLQNLVHKFCANVNRISILDIHSGLGPSATATLIANSNLINAEKRLSWLQEHYQQPVIMDSASDNAYTAQGSWSQWCQQSFHDKRFLYLCVEIGTVNPMKLFSALRRENQAHHWSQSNGKSFAETKQALLEVFAPKSPHWRRKAMSQGLHALERTLSLPANFNDDNTR